MTIIKYMLLFIGKYVYNWYYLINFTSFKYQFFVCHLGIALYSLWLLKRHERTEVETLDRNRYSIGSVDSEKIRDIITELEETKRKLKHLEDKYDAISNQRMKIYPDVKYQNYHNKKRILVSF